jgi:hypothetical protein
MSAFHFIILTTAFLPKTGPVIAGLAQEGVTALHLSSQHEEAAQCPLVLG